MNRIKETKKMFRELHFNKAAKSQGSSSNADGEKTHGVGNQGQGGANAGAINSGNAAIATATQMQKTPQRKPTRPPEIAVHGAQETRDTSGMTSTPNTGNVGNVGPEFGGRETQAATGQRGPTKEQSEANTPHMQGNSEGAEGAEGGEGVEGGDESSETAERYGRMRTVLVDHSNMDPDREEENMGGGSEPSSDFPFPIMMNQRPEFDPFSNE